MFKIYYQFIIFKGLLVYPLFVEAGLLEAIFAVTCIAILNQSHVIQSRADTAFSVGRIKFRWMLSANRWSFG